MPATLEQRRALGLEDLRPAAVLAALHDRNEVLYCKLLQDHLEEMLPVVYYPVVAMITYVDRRPLSRAGQSDG